MQASRPMIKLSQLPMEWRPNTETAKIGLSRRQMQTSAFWTRTLQPAAVSLPRSAVENKLWLVIAISILPLSH